MFYCYDYLHSGAVRLSSFSLLSPKVLVLRASSLVGCRYARLVSWQIRKYKGADVRGSCIVNYKFHTFYYDLPNSVKRVSPVFVGAIVIRQQSTHNTIHTIRLMLYARNMCSLPRLARSLVLFPGHFNCN